MAPLVCLHLITIITNIIHLLILWRGGYNGAKTTIALDDGTALKGKGKQSIPYRSTVKMAFPGGAGYGDPLKRDLDQVRLDLQKGYISLEYALKFYDFSIEELQIDFENSERC